MDDPGLIAAFAILLTAVAGGISLAVRAMRHTVERAEKSDKLLIDRDLLLEEMRLTVDKLREENEHRRLNQEERQARILEGLQRISNDQVAIIEKLDDKLQFHGDRLMTDHIEILAMIADIGKQLDMVAHNLGLTGTRTEQVQIQLLGLRDDISQILCKLTTEETNGRA